MRDLLPQSALAFRGYNVTNLGRTAELIGVPAYRAIFERHLEAAGALCEEIVHRPIDLVARVREQRETDLASYAEALALIMAVELAQLDVLEHCHGIDYRAARMSLGYSLGEITALVAGGTLTNADGMRIPLLLAEDCAALAKDVTLAVAFSRAQPIPFDQVHRLCLHLNQESRGVIGVSAYLSPNSFLLMGQQDTVDRFRDRAGAALGVKLIIRKNDSRWPPLHTPIVWEKSIPTRAGQYMHNMSSGLRAPRPSIVSLVNGRRCYNDYNTRQMLQYWTDHPQHLWQAVYELLSDGIRTVIHVGPEPNIIPATLHRLADNVNTQLRSSISMRALAVAAHRPWLTRILPQKAALLRAPHIRQIILEDWLLDHAQ